ncbi:MAG: VOC family protein [Acidobacteriaceae bacterium]
MIMRLHHAGVLVADINAASARYVDDFGYTVVSDIIHDPIQTAFVRFLKLGTEASYLELVAPDSPTSKLSNALRKAGGLNHLCYETVDVRATIERLCEAGATLISEPVPAVAFNEQLIAWLLMPDHLLVELVEHGSNGQTEFPKPA